MGGATIVNKNGKAIERNIKLFHGTKVQNFYFITVWGGGGHIKAYLSEN